MLEISLQQAHPDSNKVDQLHYSSTYQNDFAKCKLNVMYIFNWIPHPASVAANPGQRVTKFPLPKEMEVLDYKVSSSHQEYQYSEALNCCNTRYGKTQYNHSEPIVGIPFTGKSSNYTTTYSSHFGCKD